jgi:hypothetical protein
MMNIEEQHQSSITHQGSKRYSYSLALMMMGVAESWEKKKKRGYD